MSAFAFTRQKIFSVMKWMLFYAALWALLTGNQGWGFGVLFIALALFCTFRSGLRGPSLSLRHVPPFLLYFLQRLVAGGVDVAGRTLSFKPAIEPAWVKYSLQSTNPHTQLALSAIVGLLPGTLAASIKGNRMLVHVLNSGQDWQRDIAQLERHLTAIYSAHFSTHKSSGERSV